ncbi:MAG: hypothetical protein AB7E79_04395 [Rhodospirillaceae bacterium]
MNMHQHHQLPFWDAMLIATYQRAGVSIYFSEDYQDGRRFDALRVVNPFATDADSLGGPFGLHENSTAWRSR